MTGVDEFVAGSVAFEAIVDMGGSPARESLFKQVDVVSPRLRISPSLREVDLDDLQSGRPSIFMFSSPGVQTLRHHDQMGGAKETSS